MIKNIGFLDRLLRLIIGMVLIGLAFFSKSTTLAIIGLLTLFEAASSWCVFYQLIGRNTCPLNDSRSKQKIPLLKYYLSGIGILLTAIILNISANYLGWFTWYDVLAPSGSLTQISPDNWIFLLFLYPVTLALVGITIFNKK